MFSEERGNLVRKVFCLLPILFFLYEDTSAVYLKLLSPDLTSNFGVVEGQSIPKMYIRYVDSKDSLSVISLDGNDEIKQYDPLKITALQVNLSTFDQSKMIAKNWDFSEFSNLKKLIISEPIRNLTVPDSIEQLEIGGMSSVIENLDLSSKDKLKVFISYSLVANGLVLPSNIIHLQLRGSVSCTKSNIIGLDNCSKLKSFYVDCNSWNFDRLNQKSLTSLILEGSDMDSSEIDLSTYSNLRHIKAFFTAPKKEYGLKKITLPYRRPLCYEYRVDIEVKSKDFWRRIEGNADDEIEHAIGFEFLHAQHDVYSDGETTYLDEDDIKEIPLVKKELVNWFDSDESEHIPDPVSDSKEDTSRKWDDFQERIEKSIEEIVSGISLISEERLNQLTEKKFSEISPMSDEEECAEDGSLVKRIIVNSDFSFIVKKFATGYISIQGITFFNDLYSRLINNPLEKTRTLEQLEDFPSLYEEVKSTLEKLEEQKEEENREIAEQKLKAKSEKKQSDREWFEQAFVDETIEEGVIIEEEQRTADKKSGQIEKDIAKEQSRIERTADNVEGVENILRDDVKATIGEEETAKLAEGKAISRENKTKVANLLEKSIKDLEKQKTEVNLKAPYQPDDVQKVSLQTQNEIINEKIQKYTTLKKSLSQDSKPMLRRSNSIDSTLNDTYIRQGRRVLGAAAGTFSDLTSEANTMTYDDYIETRRSRLPNYLQNDPEQLATLEAGYFIFKGAAKIGEGISALDDATGNVVSETLRKIGEGFEWLGTYTRRFMRDDLGFSQRVAQNTGDSVQIAAEIFAPGAATKGITAAGRIATKSAAKARFARNLSSAYSANRTQLNWNVVKHRKGAETVLEHVTKNHGSEVNLRKDLQSMFYGDPEKVINAAWNKKIRHNIRPINIPARPNVDYYIVPWENAGCANTGILSELEAGLFPKMECNNITICTQKGTNNIITAYPSSRTADFDMIGRIAKGRNKK